MKAYREPARRVPVPRERYRATARSAGLGPRFRRALGARDAVLLGAALVFLLVASPLAGRVIEAGAADLGTRLGELFSANAGTGTIDLPGTGGTVTAQPIADGLPEYTREPQLALVGHVPSFALAADRVVAVSLNGAAVSAVAPDAGGVFRVPLTLREGSNAIELALTTPDRRVIAASRYAVVLDRQPPVLALARPAGGDEVDGKTLVVQGKTEAGASVTINERTAVVAGDGSFSETLSVTPGPLPITVVARDRAGNETQAKVVVTVKDTAPAGDVTIQVTLDQTRVRPGTRVTAQVVLFTSTGPRPDELVTVSVGVTAIGSARTDASGVARVTFTAPSTDGDIAVIALASSGTGRAVLTVAK